MTSEDIDMSLQDLTLEDTYENLKSLKSKKEQEIKKIMEIVKNNEVVTIKPDVTPKEILQKRHMFVQSLHKLVSLEEPNYLPTPNTLDFYADALKGLEDEVRTMEELEKSMDNELLELEVDIAYMEKKKFAFQQIKESSLSTINSETTNYNAVMVVTKRLFQEVKKDLSEVVDTLFPGNIGFQEFLCVLTRALIKGGDDLYIDITDDVLDFAYFLSEADIIQFHPNDSSKVKLRTL